MLSLMREVASYSEYNLSTVQTCHAVSSAPATLDSLCVSSYILLTRFIFWAIHHLSGPWTWGLFGSQAFANHPPSLFGTNTTCRQKYDSRGCEVALELGDTWVPPGDITIFQGAMRNRLLGQTTSRGTTLVRATNGSMITSSTGHD